MRAEVKVAGEIRDGALLFLKKKLRNYFNTTLYAFEIQVNQMLSDRRTIVRANCRISFYSDLLLYDESASCTSFVKNFLLILTTRTFRYNMFNFNSIASNSAYQLRNSVPTRHTQRASPRRARERLVVVARGGDL